MARKENFLKNLCNLTYGIGNHCKLTEQELLASGYYEAVVNVYRILGGVLSIYEKYKGLTIEKLIDGEYRGLLIEYINMRLDGLK